MPLKNTSRHAMLFALALAAGLAHADEAVLRKAVHARAYYAAESLGVLERIHKPLFDAIHVAGKRHNDEDSLAAFVASQDIDAGKFRQAMSAFAVDAKVRQAVETTRRVGLDGVPAQVVNGRYLTSPTLAGNRKRALAVLDFLV